MMTSKQAVKLERVRSEIDIDVDQPARDGSIEKEARRPQRRQLLSQISLDKRYNGNAQLPILANLRKRRAIASLRD